MRDSYLLAVGLLTGLTLPASALPQISDILPDNSSFASDIKQSSPNVITEDTSLSPFSNQLAQAFESLPQDGDEKSLPTLFNVSFPEFSSQPLSPSKALNQQMARKIFTILITLYCNLPIKNHQHP